MASLFKRAALAFGRFTGRRTRPESAAIESAEGMPLIESVAITNDLTVTDLPTAEIATPAVEPIDELIEKSGLIPPLDENTTTPWDEALPKDLDATTTTATTEAEADQGLAVTTSLYETPASETASVTPTVEASVEVAPEAPALPADPEVTAAGGAIIVASVTPECIEIPAEAPAVTAEAEKPVETPVAEPVIFSVEPVQAPVELKPEPAPAPLATLSELYDLVSTEANRRADGTIAVYERLLAATREELEATRRNNRVAWSVGGVMGAVAVLGAVWSSGEFAATHTEIGALKQQVSVGQQASADRDQLRAEVSRVKESYAKVEVDALKARLDQALAVSADRDRLRTEFESELRIARAGATTQPVSDARQVLEKTTARTTVAATAGDKAAGAERPDVWSVLLNGRD
jgi:hypothetical protein